MRCLVTGGEGFIGSHIVDRLLAQGHEVRVFGRSKSPYRDTLEKADYIWASLSDQEAMRRALEGVEVVFHLAWSTLPQTSNDDPSSDVADNVIGSIKLIESCARAGARRVVFASSGGTIYGNPRILPIRETHFTDPICSYGISKLAVEKYLALYHRLLGLEWVSLRCSNPYGERQNAAKRQGVITTFLSAVARDQPIEIWGDGSVVRDYVYVGDVADAFVAAATSDVQSCVLNIGSGRGASLNQIVDFVARVAGRRVEVHRSNARQVDVPINILDVRKAKHLLGWSPRTDLINGLEKTWSWINAVCRPQEDGGELSFETDPSSIRINLFQSQ